MKYKLLALASCLLAGPVRAGAYSEDIQIFLGKSSQAELVPAVHAVNVATVVVLRPEIVGAGFDRIAETNTLGLGQEAARVRGFIAGRGVVVLEQAQEWTLSVKDAAPIVISPALGAALTHMNEYFALTDATVANPISPKELEQALLSEEGVAAVRAYFEKTIAEHLELNGDVVIPEIGGEATLGDRLVLHENPDPARPMFREISRFRDDPRELLHLYEEQPGVMKSIDENGSFKHVLESLVRQEAADSPPRERRQRTLRLVVTGVLENIAGSNNFDPDAQVGMICRDEWSGRHIGYWHLHPPQWESGGWAAATQLPYGPDLEIAAENGQNLTIAFSADGFDAYDLSGLDRNPDPSRARKISYRSPQWREHFQAIHDQINLRH